VDKALVDVTEDRNVGIGSRHTTGQRNTDHRRQDFLDHDFSPLQS
jgi:hypothetical protein